ncbi:MAG: lamin tail domain-containing protein [Ignavibacteriales bacterium]|nr:lamin tail domain-containing protein [Ignavibacteriales bacterium]
MNFPGDERKDNDTAFALVTVGATPGSVLVNEIMYAPAGDEPEWVELFNPTTDTIDLKGWRISDNNTVTKTLISPTQFLLPPKGYALIAKDSSLFSVRPQITAPTRIVSFAALNNTTPDAVVLFDDRLITIDSVLYSPDWGGRGGASLERIDEYAHSTDRSNWGTSIDSTGATPGTINSIAKLTDDLELVKAYGEQTIIIVEVRNAGRRTAESFQVLFFQTNGENNTPFGTVTFPGSLSPGSSAGLTYDWTDAPVGETRVTVHVAHPPDQRLQNNTSVFTMRRSFLPRELIINEIMYEPISGQNEWIEVFHRGTNPVDLAGWSFMDRPTVSGNRNVFSFGWSSRKILPGEFVVIAAESTIFSLFPSLLHSVNVIILNRAGGFSLGNNGDDIVLKDLLGTIIDSVRYEPSWHHPDVADVRGRSLERIHPDLETNDRRNWSTSAERIGGSPGRRNSIFTERTFSVAALSFSPNPFSPDGDGHEDFCLIRYVLPHETFITRLRIFDVQGRLIRTLADGEPAGSQGEIIWDGFDSEKRRARIGPYIVLLEATDRGGHAVLSARGVVVVATRL